MAKYIRVDDSESYDWLVTLIKNSLAKQNPSEVITSSYPHLLNWDSYLANPVKAKEVANSVDDKQAILSESDVKKTSPRISAKKKSTKTRKKKKEEVDPYVCPVHKTYHGVRRPRTDCTSCWALYKQFHPMEYDKAWRDFKFIEQKKKAINDN